jgi:glycosyltransferase involved in cell wall biosynthesis
MHLFSEWILRAAHKTATCKTVCAPSVFLNHITDRTYLRKWMAYIDQYVILTVYLFFLQFKYHLIIIADHSNAPSSILVAKKRLAIMVHDSIAIREALGKIEGHDRAKLSGRLLQKLIISSLKRARHLLVNPGPLSDELQSLGINRPMLVTGCPIDKSRFIETKATRPHTVPDGIRFALNVGSDLKRKRKPELLRIWAAMIVQDPDFFLVLAGSSNGETQRLAHQIDPKRIIFVESPNDDELNWLYRNCECLIITSQFEGFCIPAIEGLFLDKPVITSSDAHIFRSIFGNAIYDSIRFDGDDPQRIQLAISDYNDTKNDPSNCNRATRDQLIDFYSIEKFDQKILSLIGDFSA